MSSGPNVHNSIDALWKDTLTRLRLVERRVGIGAAVGSRLDSGTGISISGSGTSPDPVIIRAWNGTTAERDTIFGTPANDTERVALANQKVTWFNTDLGWEESYYAVTGLTGLTATGLVPGTASGWYPVGPGPQISLIAGAGQSMTAGQTYIYWADPGTGRSWRKGGTDWFTYSAGIVEMVKAGRYKSTMMFTVQQGAGAGLMYLLRNGSASDPNVSAQAVIDLSGTWETSYILPMPNAIFAAGDDLRLYAASVGSATFMQGADGLRERMGVWSIEYLGPSLVSD